MKPKPEKQTTISVAARLLGIARAFVDGFIVPSRNGFFGMLLGVSVAISATVWFFNYETLAGPNGAYLVRSSADSDGAATYRALQVGRSAKTDPLLIVLGSSITASAFASEQLLEKTLGEETGMDWQVAMLTTALQSPIDQIALVQTALGTNAEKRKRVIVLLGVDVTHTGWNTQQMLDVDKAPRLGIRSDWADAEVVRLGGTARPRSASYILENPRFFAVNGTKAMLRLMLRRPAKRKFDLFAPTEFSPVAERKRTLIASQIRTSLALDGPGFLPVLRALDNHLDKFGTVDLALMQELPSPALLQQENLLGPVVSESEIYKRFAKDVGAEFWPLFQEVPLTARDYYDDLHIGEPGAQTEFRAALAKKIRGLTQ